MIGKFTGIIFSGVFVISVFVYLLVRLKLKKKSKFESQNVSFFEINKYLRIFDLSGLIFLTIVFVLSAVFLLRSSSKTFNINDYLFWVQVPMILYVLQLNSFEYFNNLYLQISETELKWNLGFRNKVNKPITVCKKDIQEIFRDEKGNIIIKLQNGSMHQIKRKDIELLNSYGILTEKLLNYCE